jgi:WD40 repeat protein
MKHTGPVMAVAFSPDGLIVATADGNARIWIASTGKEDFRIDSGGSVKDVAFSPDGSKIATASNDNTARIWDAYTGKELKKLVHDN